jgi:hypothetical protein
MSNDLILMDTQLPAHLQSASVDDNKGLITTGPSITRLSIKGSKFHILRGDEKIPVKLLEYNVVIVAFTPNSNVAAKTYYDTKYVEGEDTSPACMSSDGIRPDASVGNPQSTTTCAVCPKNQWGSRKTEDGRDAKACQDTKVLYLLMPNGEGMEEEVVQLRVPATSLKALSQYASALHSRQFPVNAVVTQLAFTDAAFPQLTFKMAGWLNAEQFETVRRVQAGDTLAAILKGEVPIVQQEEAQAVEVQEAPKKVAAPEPKAEPETTSLFSEDELGEEEEDDEEEIELDSDGRPWDERIDSGNKKKAKSGRWMRRKNLDDEYYVKIKRELLGKSAEPANEVPQKSAPASQPVVESSPADTMETDDELDALLADLE